MAYIKIDAATERSMEKYSEATGVTLEKAVKAALNEWYDIMGEPVVLSNPVKRRRKVRVPRRRIYLFERDPD